MSGATFAKAIPAFLIVCCSLSLGVSDRPVLVAVVFGFGCAAALVGRGWPRVSRMQLLTLVNVAGFALVGGTVIGGSATEAPVTLDPRAAVVLALSFVVTLVSGEVFAISWVTSAAVLWYYAPIADSLVFGRGPIIYAVTLMLPSGVLLAGRRARRRELLALVVLVCPLAMTVTVWLLGLAFLHDLSMAQPWLSGHLLPLITGPATIGVIPAVVRILRSDEAQRLEPNENVA
ncbi:MAG: hypothetical protein WBX15_05175 [Thermoanaerobaculia bacterium]